MISLKTMRQKTLVVAILMIAQAPLIQALDLKTRLNVKQQASEIVLGETYYQFYQGNGFSAINTILTAKAKGLIDEESASSELTLGDLYTAFGIPDEADNVFARVSTKDMRSQTKNQTVSRRGTQQFRKGDFFEAERILNVSLDPKKEDGSVYYPMSKLEANRRLMLGNILMARGAYSDAILALRPVLLSSHVGAYTAYNNGVAHLRVGDTAGGLALLRQVMDLPVSDEETNALKDRAAMAIGFNYLQQKEADKARDILINVRLDGPFSNSAILALGYANFQRKEYKKALTYWLELLNRNVADSSVQEAMLLAPRAYEALEAKQQAFFGYKLAIDTLEAQNVNVDELMEQIKKPGWLDTINPKTHNKKAADPMAVPESIMPKTEESTALLYNLFAQHPFNEGMQQYEQLKRLKNLMETKQKNLQVMKELARFHSDRKAMIREDSEKVASLKDRLTKVSDRWLVIEKRSRQMARDNRIISTSNDDRILEKQFKLQRAEESINKMPATPATKNLLARIQVLKSILAVNEASKVPVPPEKIYADINKNEENFKVTQARFEALNKLLEINKVISERDNLSIIYALEKRTTQSIEKINQSITEYQVYLQKLAESELENTQSRINNDLAQAHLNIARLQDESVGTSAEPKAEK